MSCGFSREMLALHAEGDLSDAAAATTREHLASCEGCRRFLEELHASQALMKSLRRETVSSTACTAMRREVMTIITERRQSLGWAVHLERAISLGLRPSIGMAALVLLGFLSASSLAQLRSITDPGVPSADALVRPEGYREWVLVSGTAGPEDGGAVSDDRVYMNPSSYREYAMTGRFPDGTILVWEPASPEPSGARGGPHATSSTLLVSVKNSAKFEGGWGFYDFSGAKTARAVLGSSSCRTCHQASAAKDHVFTRLPA